MSAISNASRLDEIGFPEFTASLIGSTFDALISANIRQMEAYTEMLEQSAKILKDYINETKDDITGDEVLRFLEEVLPALETDAEGETTRVYKDSTLTAAEASRLTDKLKLPAEAGVADTTVAAEKLTPSKLNTILDAVAIRLAANKYNLIQNVIKQGLLRLVIENGVLETRLHFSAWDRRSYTRKTSSYNRTSSTRRKTGASGLFSSLFSGPSISSSRNTALSVKTASTSANASSGTNINIFGGVKLNFKTDYLPLPESD
ncbi:hypothetical protein P4C99_02485 [Pontiellaceae bacterium B1224]|nr:hypothetical protein [Pontiellaceae bacterium B1224]